MRPKSWQIALSSFIITILLIVTARTFQPQHTAVAATPTSTILVSAAASLQPSLQEITPLYLIAHPGQTVNYNFAASGALQQQIEQGAPIDVFISAADRQMNALQSKGLLVSATRKNLLTNQLVLITPKQSTIPIIKFEQLILPAVKRVMIGEPRSVPAGQYATEVLKNLGIFDRVKSKFVFGSNVRSVLTAVETGDVDAGIVYLTDAQGSAKIAIGAIADPKLHAPIQYSIAAIKSSKSLEVAKQYINFLRSNPARAIFRKHGFGIAQS